MLLRASTDADTPLKQRLAVAIKGTVDFYVAVLTQKSARTRVKKRSTGLFGKTLTTYGRREKIRKGIGLLKTPKYYMAEQIRCRGGETKILMVVFRGDDVTRKEIDLLVTPKLIDSRTYVSARGAIRADLRRRS